MNRDSNTADRRSARLRSAIESATPEEFAAHYRRLHNGFYLPRESILDAQQWIRASWDSSGGTPVVGGTAAAILHGSKWFDPDFDVQLIRHLDGTSRRGESTSLFRTDLTESDIVELNGMRVTSPIRTAFDIGRDRWRWRSLGYLDSLQRATGFDAAELARYIDRHPKRRYIRVLREMTPLIDGRAESPRESWTRLLMHDAGLPRPDLQIEIIDEFGRVIARIDLGYKAYKVGIEYNGKDYHSSDEQREHDARRKELLTGRDWYMIDIDAERSRDDQVGFLTEVRTTLTMRGAHF